MKITKKNIFLNGISDFRCYRLFAKKSTIKIIVFAMLFGVAFASYSTKAQGLPCNPYTSGVFYSAPRYNYTPVLFTYMPYDVMIEYIVMDSVISHIRELLPTYDDQLGFIKSLTASGDTLNYLMKYLYRVADYNPIFYYSFLNTPQTTKKQPMSIMGEIEKQIKNEFGVAKTIVMKADYILQVHINYAQPIDYTSTDNISDPHNGSIIHLMAAHCSASNIFKGQVLPSNSDGIVVTEVDSSGIITLHNEFISNLVTPNPVTNFVFTYNKSFVPNGVVTNGDYIVFAWQVGCCYNSTTQYYEIRPTMIDASRGIYPIVDGNVIDGKNEFGWGTSVPIETFNNNLQNLINSIKNYGE
jgi:hypothetical protein